MKAIDLKPGMVIRLNGSIATVEQVVREGNIGLNLPVWCSSPFGGSNACYLFHTDDDVVLVEGPFRVRTEEESRPWGKPTFTIRYKGDSLAEALSTFLVVIAEPVKTDSRLVYLDERRPSGHWSSVRWNGQGKPSEG